MTILGNTYSSEGILHLRDLTSGIWGEYWRSDSRGVLSATIMNIFVQNKNFKC